MFKAAPSAKVDLSIPRMINHVQNVHGRKLHESDTENILFFITAFKTRWGDKPVNSILSYKFWVKTCYINSFVLIPRYQRYIDMGFLDEDKLSNTTKLSEFAYEIALSQPPLYVCNQFL